MWDKHLFLFDIERAYVDQVTERLEKSPLLALTEEVAPPRKGIYALYRNRKLVYAGKALQTTLKRRLAEHARKIGQRRNIHLREMSCRFLIVDSDWVVRAGEHALITSYKPAWNLSGFGSHVPGRGRPGTRIAKWDKEFPPK